MGVKVYISKVPATPIPPPPPLPNFLNEYLRDGIEWSTSEGASLHRKPSSETVATGNNPLRIHFCGANLQIRSGYCFHVFSQMTWKGRKDVYQNRDMARSFRDNGLWCILHFSQSTQIYKIVTG